MADFSALHVALSGLRAAQLAMDTASHNVSNANTEGYTRQRVDMASRYPRMTPSGQVGLGVEVTDITRIRDTFLDARYRSSASALSNIEARATFLDRAEQIIAEPDDGITVELGALFDAFEDLALNPPDEASRVAVLEQLGSLTGRVTSIAGQLDGLRQDGLVSIQAKIGEINATLQQVADLNVAILDASASAGTPNDLMDQRDVLLDKLSALAGVTVALEDNGNARVSIGGISLVSGSTARPLSFDDATGQVMHPSGVTLVPGGELRGLQVAAIDDIPALMTRLDDFVVDLSNALNTVHAGGFTAAGVAGGPLVEYDPLNPALSFRVAITDPADFATAASAGPPYPSFDGTIAQELSDLRTSLSASGGTQSLLDSYRAFVTALGQQSATARSSATTQEGLASAASLARDSSHGVSMDEEMVSLIEFQRMYEAAARVITTVDQALDTVINRMGVVGR
jgi:flagellar hook-associated protein 1 FlgK